MLVYAGPTAKRRIGLSELDDLEGLVKHHRKVQERIKAIKIPP